MQAGDRPAAVASASCANFDPQSCSLPFSLFAMFTLHRKRTVNEPRGPKAPMREKEKKKRVSNRREEGKQGARERDVERKEERKEEINK